MQWVVVVNRRRAMCKSGIDDLICFVWHHRFGTKRHLHIGLPPLGANRPDDKVKPLTTFSAISFPKRVLSKTSHIRQVRQRLPPGAPRLKMLGSLEPDVSGLGKADGEWRTPTNPESLVDVGN